MYKQNVDEFEKSTELYFTEIGDYKILSKDEEVELWKRYSENHDDIEARDAILKSNLKFVASVAKAYRGRGLSYSDLIAEGNMGLLKAMDKFDYTMGYKTISYSIWWIRQAIQEALDKRNLVKDEDLPMDYKKQANDSGDTEFEMENKGAIYDTSDDDIECLDNAKDVLYSVMSVLNDRENELICEYYGLNGGKPMTLEEIGSLHGLTKERVRQIKERGFKKLRAAIINKNIDNYIYR